MTDRGGCKVFSPNIFNPTKCQNCYKPKEGHPSPGSTPASTAKIQRGMSLPTRERNTTTMKTVIKEGFLSVGVPSSDGNSVKNWEKRWYILYSSGEFEGFPIEDNEVMRDKSIGATVLQDFVRMLDGSLEIGEENSLGLKSLKDTLYLKAANKVDFENWWKDLSTFVPSPMKRAYSASAANRQQLQNTKTWLSKTYSGTHMPASHKVSKQPNVEPVVGEFDPSQLDGLNSKITKLQQDVKKIPKLEEERRKLELEVNYWKEYVTNSTSSKRSGGKLANEELNGARLKIIDLQDQLNEAQKQLGIFGGKITSQNKELNESRASLEEANNTINMHKANIDNLKTELAQRKDRKIEGKETQDGVPVIQDLKTLGIIAEERLTGSLSPSSDSSSERGDTCDIESKFMTLREKMKRIEKELFLKSKELEKANESRSKVAKYTRTLLQELEAKLNSTQRKMLEASEKLMNTTVELEMERERRKRLESDHSSRKSSVSSVGYQQQNSIDGLLSGTSGENQLQFDPEVSNRYVDYYRSRFREAEAALLEKDKKLNESEMKYKEIESRYKSLFKQCRSLDDIQVKLSDATHKLSDRQLKIHELTREVEKLRGYERGYDRRTKELQASQEKVRDTEQQLSEIKRKLFAHERDLEGYKIREVVMKERLTTFEEESSDEEGDEDEDDNGNEDDGKDYRLERSIEAKMRVEKMVDLEGQVRLLGREKDVLESRIGELEEKLKLCSDTEVIISDTKNDKEIGENGKANVKELQSQVQSLEAKLIAEEDKLYGDITELKEKQKNELDTIRTNHRHDTFQLTKLKEECGQLKTEKEEWGKLEVNLKEECAKFKKENEDLKQTETDGKAAMSELREHVSQLNETLENFNQRTVEQENAINDRNLKISELEKTCAELGKIVEENSAENAESAAMIGKLTDKLMEKESVVKEKLEIVNQLQKLFTEKDSLFKNLENDNVKLRTKLAEMQEAPITALSDCEKSSLTENKNDNVLTDETITAHCDDISTEETMACLPEETITAQLEERISAQSKETITVQSEETVSAMPEKTITAQIEGTVAIRTDETITAQSEQMIATQFEETITAQSEQTIATQPEGTITAQLEETFTAKPAKTMSAQSEAADMESLLTHDVDSGLREELLKTMEVLAKSEKTKNGYKTELDDIGRKYVDSEQQVVDLAHRLQSKLGMGHDLKDEVLLVQQKVESMQKQLTDSHNSMQSKAVELEKERANIIHLVDVTSAYIKELECSMSESREKIEELQNVIEESRYSDGKRVPPEGSSGKEREDSLSDQSDNESSVREKEIELERDRLLIENEALNLRILNLESDIAKITAGYEEEKVLLSKIHEKEIVDVRGNLKRKDLDDEDGIDSSAVHEGTTEEQTELQNNDAGENCNEKPANESSDMEMLERVQELEIELAELRKQFTDELKLKDEEHFKEIEEFKEDMTRVIAASVKSSDSANTHELTELEETVKRLVAEKEEQKIRFEEELDAEKEAHQYEMEETIRDMLTVTEVFKSGKYNENEDPEEGNVLSSQMSSRKNSLASQEGLSEIRKDYDKKLISKQLECEKEMKNMKRDMLTVIEALHHGGASTAILELTNKTQALRKELDQAIADFEMERGEMKLTIERLESNNFFGLRRNEEMGTKIFQMQIELEELERKHRLEMDVYKNEDNSEAIHEVVKVNEDLEKKLKTLETELETSRDNSLKEMEMFSMKVHEEKRIAIGEMTDTVLNLEEIIDEMKVKHDKDIVDFEERSQNEKLESLDRLHDRIEELEGLLSGKKEDFEAKLAAQAEEYEKQIEVLRGEMNQKLEQSKILSEERNIKEKSRDESDGGDQQKKIRVLEELLRNSEANWEIKEAELFAEFARQTEAKQKDFDNQIMEIRSEYEEKLKSCVKESARRQSVSSRKTESQKTKELTSRVDELELALSDQHNDHLAEIDDYKCIIEKLQNLVAELRGGKPAEKIDDVFNEVNEEPDSSASVSDNDSKTRVEALENQINRYEKRIEYYKQKAEREENTESENSRVDELQEEVHGLKLEMKELTEGEHEKESVEASKLEPMSVARRRSEEVFEQSQLKRDKNKRWSDLHLTDMVFTKDGVERRKGRREMDSWKRWSDLQLKQDTIVSKIGELEDKKNPKLLTHFKRDEVAKSGSVARRKKLWENFVGEEPQKRSLSSVRP